MSTSATPGHPAIVVGLIGDQDGRWLLVQPARGGSYHLPEGIIETGETPTAACAREIREELGLFLQPGPLLALAWTPPAGADRRARFTLIFDLGERPARAERRIRLSPELRNWCWSRPDQATHLLHPQVVRRLRHLREQAPTAVYIERTAPEP